MGRWWPKGNSKTRPAASHRAIFPTFEHAPLRGRCLVGRWRSWPRRGRQRARRRCEPQNGERACRATGNPAPRLQDLLHAVALHLLLQQLHLHRHPDLGCDCSRPPKCSAALRTRWPASLTKPCANASRRQPAPLHRCGWQCQQPSAQRSNSTERPEQVRGAARQNQHALREPPAEPKQLQEHFDCIRPHGPLSPHTAGGKFRRHAGPRTTWTMLPPHRRALHRDPAAKDPRIVLPQPVRPCGCSSWRCHSRLRERC
mmetsp:Transcript_65646/g.173861  ORF Transcript_65646/g.173861 Transcript_65646/m.173861 type:complete len:257 (+) Transcript_65646:299-1069(+)